MRPPKKKREEQLSPDRVAHYTITDNMIEFLGPVVKERTETSPASRLAQATLKRRIRKVLRKHGEKK